MFFRYSAKKKADELGIKGFVRNDPDGSVYIEAEGDEKFLENFLEWCKIGPDSAKIEKVYAEEAELKNFKEFTIK